MKLEIFYYLLFFIVVGGTGMWLGSRKAEVSIRRGRWIKFIAYVFITVGLVASMFAGAFPFVAAFIVLIGLVELCIINFSKPLHFFKRGLSSLVFFFVAIGFIGFANRYSIPFLVFIYFQVLVFDGFCQVSGQLFGKHRIATWISPAKSWEGFIGGWIWCMIAALMGMHWVGLETGEALLFGAATGIMSLLGDLTASWYKRLAGVKDYSNWLPGQGGFLDRFDSFLMTGSIYFVLYSSIFNDQLKDFYYR